LRLAIGGRNADKLATIRNEISSTPDEIEILVGDSHDRSFLDAMSARTRVVFSTVGPFAFYGSELVAACAANGTHYCDLTAEPQWMRARIDQHQQTARDTGLVRFPSEPA